LEEPPQGLGWHMRFIVVAGIGGTGKMQFARPSP